MMRLSAMLVTQLVAAVWMVGGLSGVGGPASSENERAGRPAYWRLQPGDSGQATPSKEAVTPRDEKKATSVQPTDAKVVDAAFDKRLAAVDEKMAAVTDLRADFEQKKKTALLKKPIVSKGSLLCKGETVLWRTTGPRKSDMLVAGGEVTVYYPDDHLAEVYSMGPEFRDASGGPLPRLSKLRESFEFAAMEVKDMVGGGEKVDVSTRIAIRLTPKTEELKKHVGSVRVLIDERVPCAERIVIVDPEGDETELLFTGVKINSGMKDAELELKLPEKTKISRPAGTGK
ncbi:MAG: outer membrane lipoprotein carrier protein LolA [Pyrinomonadaceae bacterium]|nr:outer membrane lipoprotein carrier protein LolA [Phycisphaerales bacterium]